MYISLAVGVFFSIKAYVVLHAAVLWSNDFWYGLLASAFSAVFFLVFEMQMRDHIDNKIADVFANHMVSSHWETDE